MFAFYWICETISTVGYGDYTGGTDAEILFSLVLEMTGFAFYSLMMVRTSQAFDQNFDIEQLKWKLMEDSDKWLLKIEQSNKKMKENHNKICFAYGR